jgi:hypothetical protein
MASELVEGRYCLSSRDKIGGDHSWISAQFMEMSLCRVDLCGLGRSFGWDSIDVG